MDRKSRFPAGCLLASRAPLLLGNACAPHWEDKEESSTKAVPTVAMAVSKPPSLIPSNRCVSGLKLRWHVSGSGPQPGRWCSSPPEGPRSQHVSDRAASRPCTHLDPRAHTHSCTLTPSAEMVGKVLVPKGAA